MQPATSSKVAGAKQASKEGSSMYSRVLVPLDGSKLAEEILPLAECIGTAFNIPVELLSVVEKDVVEDMSKYSKGAQSKAATAAQVYLSGIATKMSSQVPADQVKMSVKVAKVADAIVEEADKVNGTLIALSSHGRSGLTRMVLGSIADKVLHATKSPLLLYTPREDEPNRPADDLNTIVVPVDGSELAERVLPHTKALAKALKLKIILLRVTPDVTGYYEGDQFYPMPQEVIEGIENDALNYLDEKVAALKSEGFSSVEGCLLSGQAATQIVDFIRNTPRSFAAISTHGRSGMNRWVLGSVADGVIRRTAAPVLVVRP